MNPPLHDVALHLHQRKKPSVWLYPQRWCELSATTLIMLGVCAGWQPNAQAQDGTTQADSPQSLTTVSDSVEPKALQIAEISNELTDSELQFVPVAESEIAPITQPISEPNRDIKVTTADIIILPVLDKLIIDTNQNFEQISTSLAEPESEPFAIAQATSESTLEVESETMSETASETASETTAETALETVPADSTGDTESLSAPISRNSQDLGEPLVQVQGVYTLQGEESSARGRVSASYAISPNVLVGATIDVTGGDAFSDSPEDGFDLNELYFAVSPTEVPNLRFVVGMLDLTSYFDRNSFAKDAATHFLNPVFQSNPALTAAGLGSRPAILLNWSVVDPLEIKIAGFSSDRDLGDFALDGFAGEVALRIENLILRGTYITGRDAGQDSGFREIFQLSRGNDFGLRSGDREAAYGINAEYFIPEINLGLFARYGWYENLELDRGGTTYSVGFNVLDLFMPYDRLGLAYGQALSNADLRDQEDDYPDVWELFYDFRITPNLRAGVTLQATDQFSETIGGFRIRAEFDSSDFGRLFR
jgi:hypothetical protein